VLEEIFGGLKGGVRLRGTDGKVKLETHPNLVEPLRGMKLCRRPTYHPPLKAPMGFLASKNRSFEAGIGSDQERGITLIKVKGCTVGSMVGGLSGFMGKETVKGCWCLRREIVIGTYRALIAQGSQHFSLYL
jgi:hypothetical protein